MVQAIFWEDIFGEIQWDLHLGRRHSTQQGMWFVLGAAFLGNV